MSQSAREVELPKAMTENLERPFGGLFGDTAELRVLQEIVADPYSDYSHQELMQLTGLSDPSVRKAVSVLLEHGIIDNISKVKRRPTYRPNHGSRKLTALTFLTYAALDDRAGTDSMDEAVRHYCSLLPATIKLKTLADDANSVDLRMPAENASTLGEGSYRMIA